MLLRVTKVSGWRAEYLNPVGQQVQVQAQRLGPVTALAGPVREVATGVQGFAIRACRWTNLLAEIEYFSGNVDTAAALVRQALTNAQRLPPPGQDQTLLAGLLQNDALVSEDALQPADPGRPVRHQRILEGPSSPVPNG
jgi:hypothetical protein